MNILKLWSKIYRNILLPTKMVIIEWNEDVREEIVHHVCLGPDRLWHWSPIFHPANHLAVRTFPSERTKFLWMVTSACGSHEAISRFTVTLKWCATCCTVSLPLPVTETGQAEVPQNGFSSKCVQEHQSEKPEEESEPSLGAKRNSCS